MKKLLFIVFSVSLIFITACKKKEHVTLILPANPPAPLNSGSYSGVFTASMSVLHNPSNPAPDTTIDLRASVFNSPHIPDQYSTDIINYVKYQDSLMSIDSYGQNYYHIYSSSPSAGNLGDPNISYASNVLQLFSQSTWKFNSNSIGTNTFTDAKPLPSCLCTIPSTISLSASSTFTVTNMQNCDRVDIQIGNGGPYREIDLSSDGRCIFYPTELYDFHPGAGYITLTQTRTIDTLINNHRFIFNKSLSRLINITFTN